jgi:hypothetical protein
MPVPVPERRKVRRTPFSGRLEIMLVDPAPQRVEAELIEISSMGFRAAHDSSTLEPGLEVLCKRDGADAVRARVIWTHVLGGRRVSGFLLVGGKEPAPC